MMRFLRYPNKLSSTIGNVQQKGNPNFQKCWSSKCLRDMRQSPLTVVFIFSLTFSMASVSSLVMSVKASSACTSSPPHPLADKDKDNTSFNTTTSQNKYRDSFKDKSFSDDNAHDTKPFVGKLTSKDMELLRQTRFKLNELSALKMIFERMDILHTGSISGVEFASFLHHLFEVDKLDHTHMGTLFGIFDRHKLGKIDFQDYVLTMDVLFHGPLLKSIAFFYLACDTEDNGQLSVKEVESFLSLLYRIKLGSKDRGKHRVHVETKIQSLKSRKLAWFVSQSKPSVGEANHEEKIISGSHSETQKHEIMNSLFADTKNEGFLTKNELVQWTIRDPGTAGVLKRLVKSFAEKMFERGLKSGYKVQAI